jgi:porphobilinogen synthase
MAYQVSGEYSLISNGIEKGLVDQNIILENLIAFKRAGANAIISYYADRLDKILK